MHSAYSHTNSMRMQPSCSQHTHGQHTYNQPLLLTINTTQPAIVAQENYTLSATFSLFTLLATSVLLLRQPLGGFPNQPPHNQDTASASTQHATAPCRRSGHLRSCRFGKPSDTSVTDITNSEPTITISRTLFLHVFERAIYLELENLWHPRQASAEHNVKQVPCTRAARGCTPRPA